MKHTADKKNKKLIAVTYTQNEKEKEKFQRQHLIFLLCAICGLSLSLLSAHAKAANSPSNSITIDVMSGDAEVDYGEVNQFTQAQDKSQVKFAAQDGNQITFSQKPIQIAKKTEAYHPRHLTDLGVRININNEALNENIIKIPGYMLVRDDIQVLPSIPDMIVTEAAPQVVAEAAPQVEKVAVPEVAGPSVKPVAAPVDMKPVSVSSLSGVDNDLLFWKILGSATLVLSGLLLLSRSRNARHSVKSPAYSGSPGTNEMVGKGKLFDFNGNVLEGKVTPINTTFLNMLWHVGKFSKEGSINTYFYMAFYIPPQNDYAKSLQKDVVAKEEESHTDG